MRAVVLATLWLALWSGVCSAQSSPPVVTDPAWFTWYHGLLAQRLAECPRERSQTFYFSQSGDDVSGDGTIGNPWKSLAKARAVLAAAAPAGDVAVLFKRGDVWRETPGIEVWTPRVTIADYGKGPKPLFTAFTSVGDPSVWSPTPGHPGVYQRPAPVQVTCAKQDDDLDRAWAKGSTLGWVASRPGSWLWQNGVLYVHPRLGPGGVATDPRVDGFAYEVVAVPAALASPGVRVHGDGSRIENLRAQGYGITAQQGTQMHAFESSVEGEGRAVIVGCEGHYGLAHNITHWSAEGGRATIVNCEAGLCMSSGDGAATIFNTYAHHGGVQTIFEGCVATHGVVAQETLPAGRRHGFGVYGHTGYGGAYLGLTVVSNVVTRDTAFGCSIGASFADLTPALGLAGARCFIVGEKFEGGSGTGLPWSPGLRNAAVVNGHYTFKPEPGGVPWLSSEAGGWLINSTVKIDCRGVAGDFGVLAPSNGAGSRLQAWNCRFEFESRPDQRVWVGGWGAPNSAGSVIANSVVISRGGACDPNLAPPPPLRRRRGEPAIPLRANAYWGVTAESVQRDPRAVLLASAEVSEGEPACLSGLACAMWELPGGVHPGYDQRGVVAWRNDVGPVERPWCANCDGSTVNPVLTAADFQCFLAKFAAGDPGANCDGSTGAPLLNAADFTCFQQAFVRGCR